MTPFNSTPNRARFSVGRDVPVAHLSRLGFGSPLSGNDLLITPDHHQPVHQRPKLSPLLVADRAQFGMEVGHGR